jgi:hypothetical protein
MTILEVTLLVGFAVMAAFCVSTMFELGDSRRLIREMFDLNKSMLENNVEMRKLVCEAMELAVGMQRQHEMEEGS